MIDHRFNTYAIKIG